METSSSSAHQGVGVGGGSSSAQGLPAGVGLLLQDQGQGVGVGGRGGGGTLLENACLDLFLLDLDAPPQQLRGLLAAAWDQDAVTALRLVCHRRVVPRHTGEGVSEREGFLTAALWMLQTRPGTLAANLAAFAEFGYIQDFPELLHRLVVAHAVQRREATQTHLLVPGPTAPAGRKRARDADDAPAATSSPSVPLAVADPAAVVQADEAPAATIKDDDVPFGYQILYNAILDFFVGHLRSDLDHLRNGSLSMISLAAKWCSSMDSALDQTTLLRKDIVRRLFQDDYIGATDHHVLGLLRRNVMVPLIKALEKQPQTSSSQGQGGQAPSARTKLPHQIVGSFGKENWVKKSDTARNRITEEWRSMVEGLRARGCLSNCIAVCDMSRGGGLSNDLSRLQVCVALGMLIPELSDHPWRNWVHVFSSNTVSTIPIDSFDSYTDKLAAIRETQCDDRFNLTRVFQWVLLVALEEKVAPNDMVKNIIVLTGRDFEQASVAPSHIVRPEDMNHKAFDPTDVRRWRDEYRIVKDMFHEHGFAEHVPGVVFWNLRGEPRSVASTWAKDGVMSLSGYSDDLMRLFLDKSGVVEPDDEMYAAISEEEYQKLKAALDD